MPTMTTAITHAGMPKKKRTFGYSTAKTAEDRDLDAGGCPTLTDVEQRADERRHAR